jgi:hypothetical protein
VPASWLATVSAQPDSAEAMRFFLQPRPAPVAFDRTGVLRRRQLADYLEFEFDISTATGDSFVAVFYYLPAFKAMATSFGANLQPIRSLIFGSMSDRGRAQVIEHFDVTRPHFMAAIRNGVQWNFRDGGFYTFRDPVDSVDKVLFLFTPPAAELDRLASGAPSDAYQALVGASMVIWTEAAQPIDASIFVVDRFDWEDAARKVGSSAKWVVENADNIQLVWKALGLG